MVRWHQITHHNQSGESSLPKLVFLLVSNIIAAIAPAQGMRYQ